MITKRASKHLFRSLPYAPPGLRSCLSALRFSLIPSRMPGGEILRLRSLRHPPLARRERDMKIRTSCIVAVSLAVIEPGLAQSPAAGQPSATLPLKGFLSSPPHPNATARSSARATPVAKIYNFATADYPGAAVSIAFDNNARTTVGAFVFDPAASLANAFTLKGGVYRILVVPGAPASTAMAINHSDHVVGAYADAAGAVHGFLDVEGVFSNIDFPGATHTQAIGLNDSTQVVGDYIADDTEHGFLYSGGAYTAIDYPGGLITAATGINSAGDIVGAWLDSTGVHGFLRRGGVFTPIDFPLASATLILGINDRGDLSGYYADASAIHGFVFANGAFNTVDVAGASLTLLTRINDKGQVAGMFLDALSEEHGLTGKRVTPDDD